MQHQLRAEERDFSHSCHMPLLLHIPNRVVPQLGSLSQTSGPSALRFAGSPFTTSQLPAVSDKSFCKVKSYIAMTYFCNRDGWLFKYVCLFLALLVSICEHSSSSTSTDICDAWPPLTCAETHFISFSLSCSGKHFQASQDTSLKQLEQLPGLQHPRLVQVAISINVHSFV